LKRNTAQLAGEIAQLFISIKQQDDSNVADWVKSNPGLITPPTGIIKEGI